MLQRLIDATNDSDPEKPDLLFRMAELYNEQQHYYNFRARELDEKIFDAGNAGNNAARGASSRRSRPTTKKREKQWLLASVKAYLEVADHPDKYGSYKRMDEVLFYLAYLLTQVKKEDAARKYFKRLIKDYPKSKFIPYAFLAFGEYFFDRSSSRTRSSSTTRSCSIPNRRSTAMPNTKRAGSTSTSVTSSRRSRPSSPSSSSRKAGTSGAKAQKLALSKEAKKDSVRAYARIGTPEKAWDFFRRIGGNYAMTMLEQLGELYNAQGQFQTRSRSTAT